MLETLLILLAVCAVAWLAIRVGLRRLYATTGAGGRDQVIRLVARLPLEPRRALYVVEAGGKTLLLGAAESGPMTTLAELDAAEVAAAEKARPPKKGLAELVRDKIAPKGREEP